ncbi:MAG: Arm DNA-binding domain-containing protein [Candidatus Binatia bacterium]
MAKRRARYRGITVYETGSGKFGLRLRFRLPGGNELRPRAVTKIDARPENRNELDKQINLIAAEIDAGVFRFEKWFPDQAHKLPQPSGAAALPVTPPPAFATRDGDAVPTLEDFYAVWFSRKRPPDVRPSLQVSYESHFDEHLVPLCGSWSIDSFDKPRLLWLRNQLRARTSNSNRSRGKVLSEKTVRNIVDGTLRAALRDARGEDNYLQVSLQPFAEIEWPKRKYEPTPFTEDDRDQILEWFRTRLWRVPGTAQKQPWPMYHVYVYTLFFTGMRPSELSAVRVCNVNLKTGTIRVIESIVGGNVGDTKNENSNRTARLTPENVELLKQILRLKAKPNDFFFQDVYGGSIEQGNLYNSFVDAQRACGISPLRDLYSTKDTYISVSLSNGVDLSWLSSQTGVSEWTIKKHYGRFMHHPDRDAIELAKIRPPKPVAISPTPAVTPPPAAGNGRRRRAGASGDVALRVVSEKAANDRPKLEQRA